MKDWKQAFDQKKIRIIDHSDPDILETPMASFATDDALCIHVSEKTNTLATRLWVHKPTIVLGILDARLPFLEKGMSYLREQGYQMVVRNSGGLAVVLDEGVLNFSIILGEATKLGIHDGYLIMVDFVRDLFQDLTTDIDAYEIKGSYCPGDYDLSIGGKKFAGISQRRVKNGTAVQIYLDIEGSGTKRAELVRNFYELGLDSEETRFDYPEIVPDTMRSLSELLDHPLTVSEVCDRIVKQIDGEYDSLTESELEIFEKRMKLMIDRNKKALGDYF
ncbi:lipoate--protein ligase family protein [Saliterribacillus persicus]|uniref:Octanoyl-[GcvH]:protein N-octanoyltransferase n=1 Tax=Saliterribacillus persicus TaxID=930114 RepID=A0A368YBH4_9BACI|nr:lipoate--protein ligase family protein [Saliterribacillus persicus]RCW77475.1 octanoyl-[GcvH]:protein N-octanoyltransferase/lipoyl amidotransferase [Saliterribacillus persicus]